jgi:hypothetical protein
MKRDKLTADGHRCRPACELIGRASQVSVDGSQGDLGFATWQEGRAAYLHHRAEVARWRGNPGHRHPWWWAFDAQAAAWREDPGGWERPDDQAAYTLTLDLEPRSGTLPRAGADVLVPANEYRQLAKFRYLAAIGELGPDEAARILKRADHPGARARARHQARAVREGLAMRPPPTKGA